MKHEEIFALSNKNKSGPNITHNGESIFDFGVLPSRKFSEEILKEVDQIIVNSNLTRCSPPGRGNGETTLNEKINSILSGNAVSCKLEDTDYPAFFRHARNEVEALVSQYGLLKVHSYKYQLHIKRQIGLILNRVEKACKRKSDFTKFMRSLSSQSQRISQQAQQVARMGKSAEYFFPLGKNRLLAIDSLRKHLDVTAESLLESFPLPDTANDTDGKEFCLHADAIISYHRLQEAGIDCASFEDAKFYTIYRKGRIKVAEAKRIKKYLDQQEDQNAAFQSMLADMQFTPQIERSAASTPKSLDQILSELIVFLRLANLDDPAELAALKDRISIFILYKAVMAMRCLAGKFEAELFMPPMVISDEVPPACSH